MLVAFNYLGVSPVSVRAVPMLFASESEQAGSRLATRHALNEQDVSPMEALVVDVVGKARG